MSKQFKGFDQEWLDNHNKQTRATIKQSCDMACGPGDMTPDGCICDRKKKWELAEKLGQEAETEEAMHMALLLWFRLRYPHTYDHCHSDMSGFRLGIQARRKLGTMKQSRGFPDLVLYQPRGPYRGLALELKRDGERPIKKDGTHSKDIHIQEQVAWLRRFEKCGFAAFFVSGFNEAKQRIDQYIADQIPGTDTPGAGQ